jgi:opacity protein-like surface antigen
MLRRLSVALLLLCAPSTTAQADWLLIPFIGTSFGAETSFLVFDEGAGRKLTFGGSVALIGSGILGIEADVSHTPGFFQGNDPIGLVLSSRVTTLSGNVIVAAPLAVTRESLRPYVVAGLGLMQARTKNAADLFPLDRNLLGFTIGGGALGFVTERTGVRFDIRHMRAISGTTNPFVPGVARLRFWRATAGVVVRL